MGRLREFLADHPRASLYAAADAAILQGLLPPMYALGRKRFACLLTGDIAPDIAYVAPYLIALSDDSPLIEWLDTRLGLPWGYVIESELPLLQLQLHLRRFSETRGPNGAPWLFRFWDPRVLRAMRDILTPVQTQAFMQGLKCIYLLGHEAADPVSVEWQARAAHLHFSDEAVPSEQGAMHHAGV